MAKNALITGITGQDGSYLAELLLKKGYNVYGTFRRLSTPNFWRLQALKIYDKVHLIPADLSDMGSILEAIQVSKADEVYNLAAQSFVSASFEQPISTANISGVSVVMFLEAIRKVSPETKFYQASTSEMFGKTGLDSIKSSTERKPLNEKSPFHPTSPYATAKIYAYWSTRIYREAYKLFACQGILFNHESPMRGLEFVTRKISNNVAKIHLGLEKELRLGNVKAVRDWGYAPEYVESMWRMMQHDEPDDFVVATDQFHSVSQFAEAAFNVVGLDSEKYVKVDKNLLRPIDTDALRGDYSKAREKLGWEPKTHFKELVEIMVKADVERWKMVIDGKSFPWDAPNYTEDAHVITRTLKN
jgi:GDPmannose 4,6-dehydratase